MGLIASLPCKAELSNESWFGPGIRSQPAYDGSASQRLQLVPVVRVFGDPWFLRTTQDVLEAGARAQILPGLYLASQLAYEPGRKASESPFLASHHVTDVNRGASLGGLLEWDHMFGRVPITVVARLRQHVDLERGAQADVRASAGILRRGPLAAGAYAESTWASAKSVDSFYGITPAQAATSGLPVYVGNSGWLTAVYGVGARLDLSGKWVAVAAAETRHLLSASTHSPLVEQGNNHYITLGFAYRF